LPRLRGGFIRAGSSAQQIVMKIVAEEAAPVPRERKNPRFMRLVEGTA
jgi:hypothetical protein